MNNQLTIAQILSAVNRHKLRGLITWFVVMTAVIVLFFVWPRQYGSHGTLYVQMGRNNTTITPATGPSSVMVQDTRETEIRSVVEIIKSRAVLEAVVDEVGPDVILHNKWSNLIPEIKLPSFFSSKNEDAEMSIEEYNQLKKRELATRKLSKDMTVAAEKKTSVITVFLKANSAKLAQQIVNRIFEQTKRVHLKVHAAKGSAVFFDDQFEEQERELVKAVGELAEFRNENQFLSVNSARSSLENVISILDVDLVKAEVNESEIRERYDALQQLLNQTESRIEVPTKGVERLSYEDSRTELFKLQAEEKRLTATYRENHPEVVRVKSQLAKLKNDLKGLTRDRTESQMTINPVYETLEVDIARASSDLSASIEKVKSLKNKISTAKQNLVQLNNVDVKADQLQRNVDIARQYLGIYTQKRGEAKAMALLDERNISDVVVLQSANFNVKHVNPKGSLVIPAGFLAAVLAALAVVLFAERNRLANNLNESDVERILDMPVLVTLPRVYTSRNMVN
ncbi:MAG: hypothetical protein AAF939_11650 [Planctomycetota bacterium]